MDNHRDTSMNESWIQEEIYDPQSSDIFFLYYQLNLYLKIILHFFLRLQKNLLKKIDLRKKAKIIFSSPQYRGIDTKKQQKETGE